MATTDQLSAQLDRLAALEPGPFPIVSLYLNMQPDQHGRDNFEPFLRKELSGRIRTYGADGPERKSLEQDAEKIRAYVAQVNPAVNGLAIFACSGAGVFESVELAAPVQAHRLFISDEPHLYPLERIRDEYPRFAVLVADTHSARIFVFAANAVEQTERIEGTKTKRHRMGGWSQARYQRHMENYHLQHAKEVVEALERIVRDEAIGHVIVAGDEVIVPLLRDQLAKDVADRIVDVVRLDVRAPEHEILDRALEVLHAKAAETDRERVEELLGAYRANGLACVGIEDTRKAFELGQVDELLISGSPDAIDPAGTATPEGAGPAERSAEERAADELIIQARQTSASIRFIEDNALLEEVGGVGAFLRFKF
jgi:peptide chain release factor subunit 1